jgi:hypothetical protein
MLRLVRGPAGGMLAMLLLAAALSGVAAAAPGEGDQGPTLPPAAEEHAQGDDHTQVGDPTEVGDPTGAGDQHGERGSADEASGEHLHTAGDCQALVDGLELPDADAATGLENAILRVESTCEDNLSAPGQLVALERLIENRELHADHEAAQGDHGRDAVHGDAAEDHGAPSEGPGASAEGHGASASASDHADPHAGS